MTYYIQLWRTETVLSNGLTLAQAHDEALKQLVPPDPNNPNDSGDEYEWDESDEAALKKMQSDIWGEVYINDLPPTLAEAQLVQGTGIAQHLFFDDELYSDHDRGYILARIVVDNQLELVKRVADSIKRNAEQQKREAQRQKAKQPKLKKPARARRKTQHTRPRSKARRR